MIIFNKLYRFIITFLSKLASIFRIIHFKFKYPSLSIDMKSYIGRNCIITCVDGAHCSIRNSQLAHGTHLVIEKGATLLISDSSIGSNSTIVTQKHIEIKSHCSIAEMVVIRDQNHIYGDGQLIKNSGYIVGKICLEENVWVGAKSTILKDVIIGKNSVIGAHSLVNKSFSENSVIAGIPAKLIKNK